MRQLIGSLATKGGYMRSALVPAAFLLIAACGGSGGGGGDDDDGVTPDASEEPPPPERGFRVQSPDIMIGAGQERTFCFYFRTPNTEPMAIKHWASHMTPGSHHMIMFLTRNDKMPPGTVSEANCGFGGDALDPALWTYAAQTPDAELALPIDDGGGKPLAQEVPANSAGFLQMHYFNATDQDIMAHVTVDAEALDAGAVFTKTAPFITFNASIRIDGNTTGHVESRTCNGPSGGKFWMMSTHAHKQAVKTEVKDGSSVIFSSTDWEHPGAVSFMTPDTFYTLETGRLTYECTYDNPTSRVIETGDSAATDEMCMATGYFFPATKPLFCVDGNGPF
jgi:hypothetical protein